MRIMGKEIDLGKSEILYRAEAFTDELLARDFDVKSGEWRTEDGWLVGKNPDMCACMVVSKGDYFGNVMLDFKASTILPCTRDINCMWNGSWNDETNKRGTAYVVGLQGWWDGKVGFERSPEYKLVAATGLFDFVPGREYHIQAGSIDGHAFIFADGRLLLEITDPDPIDNTKYGKIGFEAFSSYLRFRDVYVRRIAYAPLKLRYDPEF